MQHVLKNVDLELYNDYSIEKIKNAIRRAKLLDKDKEDWPHNLGSSVYRLLENIAEMAYTLRD